MRKIVCVKPHFFFPEKKKKLHSCFMLQVFDLQVFPWSGVNPPPPRLLTSPCTTSPLAVFLPLITCKSSRMYETSPCLPRLMCKWEKQCFHDDNSAITQLNDRLKRTRTFLAIFKGFLKIEARPSQIFFKFNLFNIC